MEERQCAQETARLGYSQSKKGKGTFQAKAETVGKLVMRDHDGEVRRVREQSVASRTRLRRSQGSRRGGRWGALKETEDVRADGIGLGCVHSVTGKPGRPCGC